MDKTKLTHKQREIMTRLAAVNVSDGSVNKDAVAEVLAPLLRALNLPALPIKWARDGLEAHALAAQTAETSAKQYLKLHAAGAFDELFERDSGPWKDVRDEAKTAAHGGALESLKTFMHGSPVLCSIPWRLYHGGLTGDRGRRTDPQQSPVWQASGDALEYAARACAECAWAHEFYEYYDMAEPGFRSYEIDDFVEEWFPFVDAYEAGLWLFWITEIEVIALARPILHLKDGELHSERGPAVHWPDGEEEYFVLNGAHVPREIVETPASELDPRLILRERNTEVRREIVRKIGIERVCDALGAECIDRAGNYELLLLDLQDGRHRPFLKMKNPSIGVYHIEGVAPECRTVAEALAWRNQSDVPPAMLT